MLENTNNKIVIRNSEGWNANNEMQYIKLEKSNVLFNKKISVKKAAIVHEKEKTRLKW